MSTPDTNRTDENEPDSTSATPAPETFAEPDVALRDKVARATRAAHTRRDGAPPEDPRHGLAVLTLLSTAGALVWIVAVAQMAGRGFDTTDEGYYLLSYRWWDVSFRNFTGAQYMYGPVFQALGYSIAGLRYFRLFTVVGTHAVLGYTFMRWLRLRRPHAPGTPLWEAAGVATIVAAGGAEYGWLPLSPGYNDVSLLGGFLAAAVVLRAATYVERGAPVPAWVPVALGPVAFGMLFAKWASAALSLAVVGAALLVVLWPGGARQILRFALTSLASVLATALLVHVFLVRLGTAIPPMIEINRTAAAHTNSFGALLGMYWTTGEALIARIAKRHALIVFAAVLATSGRRAWLQTGATVLAAFGLAYAYAELEAHHGFGGGAPALTEYPSGLLAGVVVAVAVAVAAFIAERLPRWKANAGAPTTGNACRQGMDEDASTLGRDGLRGLSVLIMLALAPITQAMGTGNPLYFTAINGFAAWMALIIAVHTGIERTPKGARWILGACAAATTCLAVTVGYSGVKAYPYRASAYEVASARVPGVPALASVKVSPADAAAYAHLHHLLEPYIQPGGRAMMGFDEMAGVLLVLDGRHVGEAWYSASDIQRTADGIRSACAGGRPFWGERAPLLLFRRPVAASDLEALRSCGLSFSADYQMIAPMHETMGIAVYVPTVETTKGVK